MRDCNIGLGDKTRRVGSGGAGDSDDPNRERRIDGPGALGPAANNREFSKPRCRGIPFSLGGDDGFGLPGTSLTWNSDREGLMGHGQHLKMRAMSRGAHVVTLTATDKKGNSASARVNVVIGRDRLPSSMLPNSPFPPGHRSPQPRH